MRLSRRLGLVGSLAIIFAACIALEAVPGIRSSIAAEDVARLFGYRKPEEAPKPVVPEVPRAVADTIPILMYHSIAVDPANNLQVTPDLFAAQMQYLVAAGYHTIGFTDLANWEAGQPVPVKPVLITFDDGYQDNYVFAYPILKRYGLKATIFLISGRVETPRHLNWSEIEEMRLSGLVDFGAHTESHRDLTTLTDAQQTEEIAGSKQAIEAHIDAPVVAFDYPAGRYDDGVVAKTAAAGYEFAVTTDPGYAARDQNRLLLHRVRIDGTQPLSYFTRQMPCDRPLSTPYPESLGTSAKASG